MKKYLRIFLVSSLAVFFLNSCKDEQVTSPTGDFDIGVLADKPSESPLSTENIAIKTEKLFYQPGSKLTFTGRVFDSKEKGIPEVQVNIDDPVHSKSTLGPKTDKEGRFTYSITLPSTAKGIYAFAFYFKTAKSYAAITVTPSGGLNLSNNSYKLLLGISSSVAPFDPATSIKILSNSGFSPASQDQLKIEANRIGTFMLDIARNSVIEYNTSPLTRFVTLSSIGCSAASTWSGTGLVACTPLYTFVVKETGKSDIAGTVRSAIEKTSLADEDKKYWMNAVSDGSCYLGVVGINPLSAAIEGTDAFGSGWACGSAEASVITDSKNNKSLKIVAMPSSGSSNQNVGAFVLLRRNTAPNKPSDPNPANGAENVSLTPTLSWNAKDVNGDALKFDIYFGESTSAPKKVSDQSGTAFKPGTLAANKKYYWKVVVKDGKGGETSGEWWSFTTMKSNTAPGKPFDPKPANAAINVSLNPVLSWSAKDPDGDVLKYAIYFGENTSAPKKISDQTATEFKPGTLAPGKTYYWKVVAYDGKGGETSGDWWSFTTEKAGEKPANKPPSAPSNPKPENHAVNVSLNPVLSWTAKDPDGDPLRYIIYFGDTPNTALKKVEQTGTEFKPGTLLPGKTYYWKVVAIDGKGGETTGEIWSFTTEKIAEKPANKPPSAPTSPKPENGAINVSLNPVLSWSAKDPDGDPLRYIIYFGDTPNTALKKIEQTGTEFKPGTLLPGKTYYWKVVAIDGKGGETTGDIWSFTTEKPANVNHAPTAPTNPGPANGSEKVSLNPVLTWIAKDPDGDALKYVVYFGESTSAPKKVSDLTAAEFKPGTLAPGQKYYWRIVAYDGKGGEASSDWWTFTTVK